jgi:glycosyltransferase involved in cell wall biosynthesis
MRDYHAKVRVAAAPYRFGAGTKLKVLEAMACGTPVVSTSVGCRGLDVVDSRHLLLADTEPEFADRVGRVLRDPKLAQSLATAARKLAEEKYSWSRIGGELEPNLRGLVGRRASSFSLDGVAPD